MLEIADLMRVREGKGIVNVLAADRLMNAPKLYSSFLLWLLSELFEQLPEVGDPDKPKLVFFFDEAHLLFDEAPKALIDKVEQVVRLIRSKGVGVYFVTQNPLDVPESVLGQLGNRVQHALRAFTPRDQKAVKTAAETLRPNPKLKAEKVITELGVGEALVSLLDEKGRPSIVERAFIVPPASQIGPISADERAAADARFRAARRSTKRPSIANRRTRSSTAPHAATRSPSVEDRQKQAARGRQPQSIFDAATKSAARAIGSELGRQIIRGVLGSILGSGRRR